MAALVAVCRAGGDTVGLAQIEAADRGYLQAVIDGEAKLSEAIFERMEPMFATYEGNADMMALLDRAATAYADAAVRAAYWCLAAAEAADVIGRAMGRGN